MILRQYSSTSVQHRCTCMSMGWEEKHSGSAALRRGLSPRLPVVPSVSPKSESIEWRGLSQARYHQISVLVRDLGVPPTLCVRSLGGRHLATDFSCS